MLLQIKTIFKIATLLIQNSSFLVNIVLILNNIIIDSPIDSGYTNISLMNSIKRAN